MAQNQQEIESKFYLNDLPAFEEKLKQAGAVLAQARVYEVNLRFDTPARDLQHARRVLRLRRDTGSRLTYKDPALPGQPVSVRREIEFGVSDFDSARDFLEALGYEVSIMYEKYRATYYMDGCEVVLDEMPYGNFCEIEGGSVEAIQALAGKLGLDVSAGCPESYMALFLRLKEAHGLAAENLSFAELEGQSFSAADMGLRPADRV